MKPSEWLIVSAMLAIAIYVAAFVTVELADRKQACEATGGQLIRNASHEWICIKAEVIK